MPGGFRTLTDAVAQIRKDHYACAPATKAEIEIARGRGVPEDLLDFYSLSNGVFLGEGSDFLALDGRRFRFSIPALLDLQCAKDGGYISSSQPLFKEAANWWQIVDYGDGNWLAFDANPGVEGRIIDLFHETAGEVRYQEIVATSLVDLLGKLLAADDVYWLDESFEPLGYV